MDEFVSEVAHGWQIGELSSDQVAEEVRGETTKRQISKNEFRRIIF